MAMVKVFNFLVIETEAVSAFFFDEDEYIIRLIMLMKNSDRIRIMDINSVNDKAKVMSHIYHVLKDYGFTYDEKYNLVYSGRKNFILREESGILIRIDNSNIKLRL